jgi:hypothetical protein
MNVRLAEGDYHEIQHALHDAKIKILFEYRERYLDSWNSDGKVFRRALKRSVRLARINRVQLMLRRARKHWKLK